MKKVILVMILFCLISTGCGNKLNESMKGNKISVEEVQKIVENYSENLDVYIIDVRELDEYEKGHLKNAVNVPLDHLDTIGLDKGSKIIVYCQSGKRSASALSKLKELGYTNVYDMGGINNWLYELEK